MNNVVSFETAKRLKEAGFPQPLPAFGQMWYYQTNKRPRLIVAADALPPDEEQEMPAWTRVLAHFPGMERPDKFWWEMEREAWTFAPTATNILPHLPYPASLIADYGGFMVRGYFDAFNTNPAEACAQAWFIQKEKSEKA